MVDFLVDNADYGSLIIYDKPLNSSESIKLLLTNERLGFKNQFFFACDRGYNEKLQGLTNSINVAKNKDFDIDFYIDVAIIKPIDLNSCAFFVSILLTTFLVFI